MPLPNTRIAIIGVPRAEKDFDVLDVSKAEAQRLAKQLAVDAERAKQKLKSALRGSGR